MAKGSPPAYSVKSDGLVTCRNHPIGRIDLDTGEITMEARVLGPAMTQIKAHAFDRMAERKKPRGKPLIEVFREEEHEQATSLLGPDSREEFASSQPPPPPAQDPRLGDKTPAYMQWLGENFPDEYRKRYKGRKTHLTTGINPHLFHIGDIPERDIAKDPTEEWR